MITGSCVTANSGMTSSCGAISSWAAGSCVTTNSGMTGSCGTISSWAVGSCVTTKFWEEAGSCVSVRLLEGTGSCVTVTSLTTEDNGRIMGIVYSIFFHPTATSVDLADQVLLLGNVETKTRVFLFFALGEGGRSSTTRQGGKYAMLGFFIICT
jgi:hypothetical protein